MAAHLLHFRRVLAALAHVQSAVHVNRGTRDKLRVWTGQEDDRAGNVLRRTKPAEGRAGDEVPAHLLWPGAGHFGIDDAGGDGVDADSLRSVLAGQRPGQADDPRLARGVIDPSGDPPTRAAREEMLTIAPLPWRTSSGKTACVTKKTALRLMDIR